MTDEEFAEWAKQNMGSVIGIGIDMGTFGKQDALNLLKSYAKGLGEALAEGGTYMPGGKSEEKFVESLKQSGRCCCQKNAIKIRYEARSYRKGLDAC